MFYISRDYGNAVYGVTDSVDDTTEKYSVTDIETIVRQGIKVKGYTPNKIRVYPTLADYAKYVITKERLVGNNQLQYFDFSNDYKKIEWVDKYKLDGVVVIPDFVHKLNDSLFEFTSNITSVVLPNGLQEIPCSCFASSSIEQINIPDSVKYLRSECFYSCYRLKNITLPNNVLELGRSCFKLSRLETITIPNNVSSIESDCFNNCSYLKEVKLPKNISVLKPQTFISTGLERIVIPDGVTEIQFGCFMNCRELKDVILPDTLQKLGECAFSKCVNLKEMRIPESLVEIGLNCFQYSGLEDVELPKHIRTTINSPIYNP